MELDFKIKKYIEDQLSFYDFSIIKNTTNQIISDYLNNDNKGHFYIKDDLSAKIYASYRMPSTYKVVSECLSYIMEIYKENIDSFLDVGAGTGAACLAIHDIFGTYNITCYENNENMFKVGENVTNTFIVKNVCWKKLDITNQKIDDAFDMVSASYVLNEINEKQREEVILKLWEKTNKILLLIEPGTPNGYSIIKNARDIILNHGGFIIAPCPHMNNCPMGANDWCHFATRVARDRFHKLIKNGDAPYEDEKYSYIVFSKTKCEQANSRIIRHPLILPSLIKLEICDKENIKQIDIRKSNKEIFKKIKKKKCGDTLSLYC